MEYLILDNNPIINGTITSNFVHIQEFNSESCKVYISNRQAEIHTISITNGNLESSVNEYFNNIRT